jgi:hypothetical protein
MFFAREGEVTMSSYESYRDVLSENATHRSVFGSSMVVILLALATAVAASLC